MLSCTPIQIIGGDADVDHSQTIGGIQPNYWGDISPHPPPVSAPLTEGPNISKNIESKSCNQQRSQNLSSLKAARSRK